jgi:hypothetical protein
VDPALPAAPWLLALAALASALASVMTWRAVPWQGRQSALVMAAAMLVASVTGVGSGWGIALGAVLLGSAMLGTVGVRGRPDAALCCHRALVALVLAICAFQGVSTGTGVLEGEHGSHGLTGVLSVFGVVGVIGVVLWTIASEWFVESRHQGRTAAFLTVQAWSMAAGAAVLCLGL